MKKISKFLAICLALTMLIPFNAFAEPESEEFKPEWVWSNNYSSAKAIFSFPDTDPIEKNAEIISVIKDATCTEPGGVEYTATVEFDSNEYSDTQFRPIGAPNGHDLGEWEESEEAVAATCTAVGKTAVEKRECSHCDYSETRGGEEIPATGHTAVEDAAVEATCTGTGLTAGSHCSVCNTVLTAQEVIPATGHTEVVDEAVAPTCTKTGLTEGSHCSVCKAVIVAQKEVSALSHDLGEWQETEEKAVAATCTKAGKTAVEKRECSRCDYSETRGGEEIPATGHTSGKPKVENYTFETCSTEGSYDLVVYCTVCGEEVSRDTETIEIDSTKHNYVAAVTEPTCTERGFTTYTCEYCGDSYVENYVNAKGHTAVEDATVEATCTGTGLTAGSHCSVCGEVITAQTVVAALGHNYSAVVTAPTCTKDGYTTYTCTVCKFSYVGDYVGALGHTPADAVTENEVASTCTKQGSYDEVVYCSVCDEELSRETKSIDKLPHTPADAVTENEVASTCTKQGSYDEVVYCSVCDEELSRETKSIDKLPHTPANAVKENEVASTCTKQGSYDEVVYCSVCGEEISREAKSIDKLVHTVVIDAAVPATCTQTGLTEGSHCSVCNTVLTAQNEVPATGHTQGEAKRENEIAATCTKDGSYDSVVYCTVCNEEISRTAKTIKKTGHNWKNGKCSDCSTPDEYKGYATSLDKDVYYYGEKWSSTITLTLIYEHSEKVVTTKVKPTGFRNTAKDQSKLDTLNGLKFSYNSETYTLKNEIVLSPYGYCYVNYVQGNYFNKTSGKTITRTAYVSGTGTAKYDYQMMLDSRQVTLSSKAKQYLNVDYDGSAYGKIKISVKSAAIPANSNDCYIILSGKSGSKTFKTKIIIRYRPTVSLSAKSKAIKVSWNTAPAIDGYQIQYSTSSKFASPKLVTISNKTTISKTISSLKSKKIYYVRVRAYKKVSGKTVVTNWSASKKVKTK